MATVQEALKSLGITDYVMRGTPTNESEFNTMFRKATVDSNGNAVEDATIPFGVTWAQVSAKKTELENAEPLAKLRKERNRKLVETDWTQNRDVTLSNDADWKTYRQALRDITKDYKSLEDVKWPEKPE